jgi:hypothetical protein
MAAIEPEKFEALLELHRAEVLEGNNKVSVDLMRTSAEADGRDKRRALAAALSDATAELPTGRKFPCVYADPPWRRKQGVTGRSYENHYPTMTGMRSARCRSPICCCPTPGCFSGSRARICWRCTRSSSNSPTTTAASSPARSRCRWPGRWRGPGAAMSYSTCYVWTKTDEEHPDDHGGGVLVL